MSPSLLQLGDATKPSATLSAHLVALRRDPNLPILLLEGIAPVGDAILYGPSASLVAGDNSPSSLVLGDRRPPEADREQRANCKRESAADSDMTRIHFPAGPGAPLARPELADGVRREQGQEQGYDYGSNRSGHVADRTRPAGRAILDRPEASLVAADNDCSWSAERRRGDCVLKRQEVYSAADASDATHPVPPSGQLERASQDSETDGHDPKNSQSDDRNGRDLAHERSLGLGGEGVASTARRCSTGRARVNHRSDRKPAGSVWASRPPTGSPARTSRWGRHSGCPARP